MTTLQIELPDGTAQAARAAGLLTPQALDRLLNEALRKREAATGRHTPVLMVTAHAMTGDRERFLAAGADGYVSKPMSEATLGKEIARVVKGF